MELKLYIQDNTNGEKYDVSELSEAVKIEKYLDGEAGKLTCVLQKDPNEILHLSNGSPVEFVVDGKNIFFGYIFKVGTDLEGNYKITCYDQLRYLKNTGVYALQNMTASDIFKKVCEDYDLKYEVRVSTNYVPSAYQFTAKSLYSIIDRGRALAMYNDKKYYYIVDEAGTLVWTELSYEGQKLSIILGDAGITTSFTYEKSIDEDTYNFIKMYRENKTTGKTDTWNVYNGDTIKQWGLLQLMKKADDKKNASQIKEDAENYLKVKNRETETLKIQAEGILECMPGARIKFELERENLEKWMYITSATHTFTKDVYIMDLNLEVQA